MHVIQFYFGWFILCRQLHRCTLDLVGLWAHVLFHDFFLGYFRISFFQRLRTRLGQYLWVFESPFGLYAFIIIFFVLFLCRNDFVRSCISWSCDHARHSRTHLGLLFLAGVVFTNIKLILWNHCYGNSFIYICYFF
jgi:hypothetical protein